MSLLSNLRLGPRLGLAFAAATLMVCVTGGFGLRMIAKVNGSTEEMATNWLPSVETLGDLKSATNDIRRVALRHLVEPDAAGKRKQQDRIDVQLKTELPQKLAAYEKMVSSPEEAALFKQIQSAMEAFKASTAKLVTLSDEGAAGFDQARNFAIGQASDDFTLVMNLLQKDVELNSDGGKAAWTEAQGEYNKALMILGAAMLVSAAVCGMLAVRITRSITVPLAEAVSLSEAVAQGDLTRQVQTQSPDEVGDLMRSLNLMSANLSRLVGEVRQGTENIATASAQIAQGNADLSSRTEQQAASLQETAASMHQINDTVRSNSDNAQQAHQLASQVTLVATQGGDDVGKVVSTMAAIQESSRSIAEIINVIDGIAFQTNILALNAAVEAARAGEQGRGFAVVASEVRSLAQRSANAAKEIKTLITNSVEKVEMGNTQVNNAGRTIQDVVAQVRKVNGLITEITASSNEQSTGVGQINQAVNQLDQATQQNAALVEETSAAAESLRNQAESLLQSVSVFRVRS